MMDKKKVLELIKGNNPVSRSTFFATVSGVVTTNPGMIRRVDNDIPEIGLITTKSFQVEPNPGNREPVIVEPEEGSFGNAVGLRNPGMKEGLKGLEEMISKKPLRSILNVSVSGNSVEEFVTLVRYFEDLADIIELNLSCPHASGGYGMAIGKDPEVVYTYLKEIRKRTDALVFAKLTPNVDAIGETALAAVEGGADGITAINTVGPGYYTEPVSGAPLLLNASGNKGGMSGRWIKETALEKAGEIRKALGPDIPIIGMGGIENGRDVRNMMNAGADVVGIGSIFASIEPWNWQDFFKSLKTDLVEGGDSASRLKRTDSGMKYEPHTVTGVTDLPDDVRIIQLDGKIKYDAGQFAFLWIPGTGEKPFSIMSGDPLTFLIKKKGIFTSRVMELKAGDRIFVRGLYGKIAPETGRGTVLIAAGGTGLASALKLAEKFAGEGKRVHTFQGMSTPGQEAMADDFLSFGSYTAVPDMGIPGRVIDRMMEALWENKFPLDGGITAGNCALYTIGPRPFMEKAARAFTAEGGSADDVLLSIETHTKCGVGLCGECECRGHLTCREGAWFKWSEINED